MSGTVMMAGVTERGASSRPPINIDAPQWATPLQLRQGGDVWAFDATRELAVTLFWSREANAYVVREWAHKTCLRKWTDESLEEARVAFLRWAREIIIEQAFRALTNG